jgi:putative membrane protein
MILPGISGSFILLILGKYQFIMSSISSCIGNIGAIWGAAGADAVLFWKSAAVMAVFMAGAVVGIISFSKFLHWLLAKWHKETLIVLAGFIIGSLVKVWPWSNMEAIVCSQFPDMAAGELNESIIQEMLPSIDMHIGGAVLFAIIGFCLVSGIEVMGKMISQKK